VLKLIDEKGWKFDLIPAAEVYDELKDIFGL
jgi:hypothetical protein